LDRMAGWRYISAVLNAIGQSFSPANAGVCANVISSLVESTAVDPGGEFVPGDDYFSALEEPFGTESLDLGIGPLRMRLDGLSSRQADALKQRFRPFVVETGGSSDVVIRLRQAGVPGFLRNPNGGRPETYRLESRALADGRALWSYEFAGTIEARGRQALLALVRSDGPLFDRGLENFLRILTASFILDSDGFLLHASGVVRKGRAYVFFGPSGAGKTTVTHLSPGDRVLSDDLTLVVRHDGRYEAAGIPFGMAHHHVPDTCGSFPIASFNRLVQSREVRREPLAGARAVAEVASSLPFVMQEASKADRAVDVVASALREIPAYRLHFRRDAGFWDVVEENRG